MPQGKWTRRSFLALTGAVGAAALTLGGVTRSQQLTCYSQSVLAKNPVAYWRLGERQGPTVFDVTQNSRDGVYYGVPTYGEGGALVSDPDTAVGFDDQGTYIEIDDSVTFSQPTSNQGLTVEAWMRPDTLTFAGEAEGYVHWLGKGEPGRHEWAFRFYSQESSRPNRISVYIWNPAGGLGAGAYFQDTLEPGVWIHVVACYDPGDQSKPSAGVSIYKNGVLRGGPATSPGALYRTYQIEPAHGTAPLRLGTRDRNSFFEGRLDEVAIYPHVLTSAEILENYQRATTPCIAPSPTPTVTASPTVQSSPSATKTMRPNPTATTTPCPRKRVLLPVIQR